MGKRPEKISHAFFPTFITDNSDAFDIAKVPEGKLGVFPGSTDTPPFKIEQFKHHSDFAMCFDVGLKLGDKHIEVLFFKSTREFKVYILSCLDNMKAFDCKSHRTYLSNVPHKTLRPLAKQLIFLLKRFFIL